METKHYNTDSVKTFSKDRQIVILFYASIILSDMDLAHKREAIELFNNVLDEVYEK